MHLRASHCVKLTPAAAALWVLLTAYSALLLDVVTAKDTCKKVTSNQSRLSNGHKCFSTVIPPNQVRSVGRRLTKAYTNCGFVFTDAVTNDAKFKTGAKLPCIKASATKHTVELPFALNKNAQGTSFSVKQVREVVLTGYNPQTGKPAMHLTSTSVKLTKSGVRATFNDPKHVFRKLRTPAGLTPAIQVSGIWSNRHSPACFVSGSQLFVCK